MFEYQYFSSCELCVSLSVLCGKTDFSPSLPCGEDWGEAFYGIITFVAFPFTFTTYIPAGKAFTKPFAAVVFTTS